MSLVVRAFIVVSVERVADIFLALAGPLVTEKDPSATDFALSLMLEALNLALRMPAEAFTLLLVFFTHRHSRDILIP